MQENGGLLKDIHAIEFELLEKCKALCEKYHLPYYLCYGTLLGAVRHKGFIPWDDDIDIMMPVETIGEFKKLFLSEYKEPVFYEDIHTEKTCIEPWIKIRRSDTCSMPRIYAKIQANWGICIDIFPLYPASANRFLQIAKRILFKTAEVLLSAETAKYDSKSRSIKRVISSIPYCLRKMLSECMLKLLSCGKKDSEYLYDGFMFMKRSDIVGESVFLTFENQSFAVPCRYHQYLTNAYGDYMQLPPENERNGHTGEVGRIIWDTKNSYRTYQDKL